MGSLAMPLTYTYVVSDSPETMVMAHFHQSVLSLFLVTYIISNLLTSMLADKPPINELHQFLEFQLPRQWAPVFSDLPLGPQRRQSDTSSLQFSFLGPKLLVNISPVMSLFIFVFVSFLG